MKIIKINPNNPDLTLLNEVIEVLRNDGVVLYPTDTIYGLGANVFSKKAINKVFAIKKRDKSKAISISVNNLDWINKLAIVNNETIDLISRFLPGPFTFLLTKNNDIFTGNAVNNNTTNINNNTHNNITNINNTNNNAKCTNNINSNLKIPIEILANSNKVGIRMPNNPIAIYLAKEFPITTTSANISNNDILSNPIEIANELNNFNNENNGNCINDFNKENNGNNINSDINNINNINIDEDADLIDIVIDMGNISSNNPFNNPSTIVDLSNGINKFKIIRQGTGKFLL